MNTEVAKPQLHVSDLTQMAGCGVQWQYRRGAAFGCWPQFEIRPPSIALAVGSAVHSVVEQNLSRKMEFDQLMPIEEVKDTARDTFRGESSGEIYLGGEEIGLKEAIDQGVSQTIALATLHHEELAPKINPLAIEEKFVIELPDHPFDLSGQKDIREEGCIRDTKTKAQSPPADAAKSLQMAMYSLSEQVIRGAMPKLVVNDFLVKTKKPKLVTVEAVPDASWTDPLFRRIERAIKTIKAVKEGHEAFQPADPNSWVCSAKYCGWHDVCPFWSGR